jgi:hypothetical protein
MTSILSFFVILILISNPRKIFYAGFNIGKTRYKTTRFFLLVSYWGCWTTLIIGSQLSENFIVGDWHAKGLVISPAFAIFSTAFATVILALDANYRASRRLKFEKNFLKHTFMGWSFVPAYAICAFMNKPLIALLAVVTLVGWFSPLKSSEG